MRIPSGVIDQYIYFVAVDATDFTTRETGLTSFTVYRSRNGGAATAITTPTINETDTTNMPGVYELLLDEDMTIDAGDDEQEMVFHITEAAMAPVTRAITLYRSKITAGDTLATTSGAVDTVTTNTDLVTAAAIRTEMDSNSTQLAAIVADTAEIGTAGAGLTDLGGMSTGMKAEVNAEALDVLNTDTFAEPAQGTPAATTTLAYKIGLIYKYIRNRKTETSTTFSLYNDDATTVDHKSTVSDDGTTADKTELTTGP